MSVEILVGDCRDRLRELPDQSVDSVVTSPPYFGLRDYRVDGQIGLEPTPAEFVAALVEVFRELRRVLRDDGTAWLNLGDSYARTPAKGGSGPKGKHDYNPDYGEARKHLARSAKAGSSDEGVRRADRPGTRAKVSGLGDKQLIGIPWRVAFALQDDGWFLRQDIVWSKPNPMPESVEDRCTKAHEYLFLLSKQARYFFDADAIAEPASPNTHARRGSGDLSISDRTVRAEMGVKNNVSFQKGISHDVLPTRNKRSVWTVGTEGFDFEHCESCWANYTAGEYRALRSEPIIDKGEAVGRRVFCRCGEHEHWLSHFATFPAALIEPCILAGTPKGGTVLDPFGGAATTGLVADRLQRNAILFEMNPHYASLARYRIDCARGGLLDLMEAV